MPGNKIRKGDIVETISLKTDIERKDIHEVVDMFLGELKQGLTDGCVIELRGFGTFEVRIRKGRKKARNPKTGESVSVESHGVAAFRPGKELKKAVWPLSPGEKNIQSE